MDDIVLIEDELKKMDAKMYSQTNEDLDALFCNFDFNNKEVLSVLASSDQMLNCYYMGAKNVDTFDKNERAAYYYYFRKWFINNYNDVYQKLKCFG